MMLKLSQYRSHGYLFNRTIMTMTDVPVVSQYRSHGYLFNQKMPSVSKSVLRLNTVLTVISLITYWKGRAIEGLSQYRSHGYLFNHFNFQQHQSSFQLFLLLQSSHDYLFNKHFSHFSQVYSFFITNEKKTTLFILKNTSKSINQSVFP